jgi:hypothetical protein
MVMISFVKGIKTSEINKLLSITVYIPTTAIIITHMIRNSTIYIVT